MTQSDWPTPGNAPHIDRLRRKNIVGRPTGHVSPVTVENVLELEKWDILGRVGATGGPSGKNGVVLVSQNSISVNHTPYATIFELSTCGQSQIFNGF